MNSDRRGISPVVGTVILIGITVAIVAVSGYILLDINDTTEPAPEVAFELQEQNNSAEYVLVHTSGDRLDGDNLTLRGTADPDSPAGRAVTASDTLPFYPVAEEVVVVWEGETDTTYTLTTLTVEESLPDPDEGCDWVDQETDGGNDSITVDGMVINCDVGTDEQVTVRNGGVVVGEVTSGAKEFDGDDATVYGTVDAENVVNLQTGTITGDAVSQTADVKLDDAAVEGSVESETVAELTSGTVVEGDVESKVKDSKVLDSTVEGSVTADGIVKLQNATVEEHVYIDPSDFDCTDSTVNGQDCGSYTPRDPGDW